MEATSQEYLPHFEKVLREIAVAKSASHSFSNTPLVIVHFHAGLRRTTSYAEMSICRHPIFLRERMDVPKTTISIPDHRIAPWHIGHGSAVE